MIPGKIAELPACRARLMARQLLEVRDAVYNRQFDVAAELLTGFRAHIAFLGHELSQLERAIQREASHAK